MIYKYMDYVQLTDYDDKVDINDKPIRLTKDQINFIISHVPYPPAADQESATLARNGIVEWLEESLRDAMVAPSAIPSLINQIVKQHYKSLVTPGTPSGIGAGEAVGAITTQMTLNSVAPWEELLIQDMDGNGHKVE